MPTLTCKYSNGSDVVSEPLHQSIGADHVEDRFEYRFRHRRFFVDGFDNFVFLGVPFAYDYAAYGNGCWRWDGWQWINICYNYDYGY